MLTSLNARRVWPPLLLTLAIFAAAVGLRLAVSGIVGTRVPYVTFFPAVMCAALSGGIYAGMLVTLLSACFVGYFLLDPVGAISLRDAGDWLGMITFLVSCTMASWLSETMRRASSRADESEVQVQVAAERERICAALQQSQARFRSYLDSSPIAVLVVDRSGNYVDFNASATALLGYPAETLARMHILEVHRIEDHQRVLNELASLFDTGRLDVETCMLRSDGRTVWVSLHAACLDSDHIIAYCQDITDRKGVFESMRERLALQEQLSAITSVVPGIIHSLRLRPDGSFCLPYAGPELERTYGLASGDVAEDASAVLNLVHPEDREQVCRAMTGSARTMTPWRDEFRVRHPQKGYIWVGLHSIPHHEDDGSILWQGFIHDITQRRTTEEMVRETSRRLELAVDSAGLGVWEWNLAAGTLLLSDRMCELYGITREEFDGSIDIWTGAVHPDDRLRVMAEGDAALRGEEKFKTEFRVVHADGKVLTLKAEAVVVSDEAGRPVRMIGLNRDITEQRSLEAQLQQAQKMDAIGRLAGGIAHDFNNNLSVILGYAELCRGAQVNSSEFHDRLEEIIKAAQHSRDVTRQLLAFSRNEIIAPRRVDLNHLLRRNDKALWRMIGEHIRLSFITGDDLWPVLIDPAQFDQIVINLAVNALDAMPDGGSLSIETKNVSIEEMNRIRIPEVAAGEYVQMTVTDTGVGMDRELQGRIFEPFYTTKGIAKGTGLGLSTVYGMMSQNGGFITVCSEPGHGSAFSLFFPRTTVETAAETEQAGEPPQTGEPAQPTELAQAAGPAQAAGMAQAAGPAQATEPAGFAEPARTQVQKDLSEKRHVLLVEDEVSVRLMAQLMLEKFGYTVLVAESPLDALKKCRATDVVIDCLLTDVIMPGMNGMELSIEVKAICPGIGIVYMSGYSADMIAQHGVLEPGVRFLQKPFDINSLKEKVQQAIQASRKAVGPGAGHVPAPSPLTGGWQATA